MHVETIAGGLVLKVQKGREAHQSIINKSWSTLSME